MTIYLNVAPIKNLEKLWDSSSSSNENPTVELLYFETLMYFEILNIILICCFSNY